MTENALNLNFPLIIIDETRKNKAKQSSEINW